MRDIIATAHPIGLFMSGLPTRLLAALADAGVLAAPDAPPALIPIPAPDWETWDQYGVEHTEADGRTWIDIDDDEWAFTDRDQLDPQPGERVMRRTWYGTPWEEDDGE